MVPATPPVAAQAGKPITDNAKAKKAEPKGNWNCIDIFLLMFDFYRAMLCIRGTSHGPVSVRPSQAGVLLKRQNVGSRKQHHKIPQGI